nr:immunoglobulin superfamily member 10-like [Ciona intestinalis]|eukprot:XP_002127092.1 immunoglobulin superfamily member 10-like [Ciona intestinalis]
MKKVLFCFLFAGLFIINCKSQFPGMPPPPMNNIQNSALGICPSSCNMTSQPCDCYTDGFVECGRKQLIVVPRSLPSCAKLVNLQHNNISNISVWDFQALTNADTLKLSFNKIQHIAVGAMSFMPNLTKVDLNNNLLTTIEDCTFHGLQSLRFLYIEHNQIDVISPRAFSGLYHLHTVSFIGNRITTFNPQWFYAMPQLHSFTAPLNPWLCTCQLKSNFTAVINNFSNITIHCPTFLVFKNTIISQTCLTCTSPVRFLGRPIHNITLSEFTDCGSITQPVLPGNLTAVMSDYCQAKVERNVINIQQPRPNNNTPNTTNPITLYSNTTPYMTTHINTTNSTASVGFTNSSHLPRWSIVVLIVGLTIILLAIIIFIALCLSRKQKSKMKSQLSGETMTVTSQTNGKHETDPLNTNNSDTKI